MHSISYLIYRVTMLLTHDDSVCLLTVFGDNKKMQFLNPRDDFYEHEWENDVHLVTAPKL